MKQSHQGHQAFIAGVLQEVNSLIVKGSQGQVILPSIHDIKEIQRQYALFV